MGKKTLYTIGVRPEFFLRADDGTITSAYPYIPEHKQDTGKKCRVWFYNDTIKADIPPAQNENNLIKNVTNMLEGIFFLIPSVYHLEPLSAENVSDIDAGDFEYPIPKCAYSNGADATLKPLSPTNPLRFGNGSICIGAKCLKMRVSKVTATKLLDATVGMAEVIFNQSDGAKHRRSLYGQAGMFIPTPYGLEYVTPSNFWFSSPKATSLLYQLCAFVIRSMKLNHALKLLKEIEGDFDMPSIINQSHTFAAISLLGEYIMPRIENKTSELFVEVLASSFRDIRTEWNIAF